MRFQDYLVLLSKNNSFELTSCYIDNLILLDVAWNKRYKKYRSFNAILSYLKKHNISYVIINNTDILEVNDAIPNNYGKYYYLMCFKKIFKSLKR